ncbi:MAG: DNA polymerase III subunit delta [Methylophilaceae bacterium]|nr:DNA polymerase III subunit delta [Methylophilaceae bacterium]
MLLKPEQLEASLKKGLQPLYVLVGDEPLAQKECLDAIRLSARLAGCEERTSFTVDRYFNWQQLIHFDQSMSLFSNLRLLELHIPTGKPGIEGGKALTQLANKAMVDTTVIIVLPTLERDSKNSAWYTNLEQTAACIPLSEVSINALPQWIAQRMGLQGQITDDATLEFIANQVEGNLLAAHQEIQKLGLLYPAGKLTDSDVREAVLNVSRFDAFQLGEAVLAGDAERVVRIAQGLQHEGEQAVAVMNPLMWVLRPLVRIKHAEARGENLNNAMTQARIFGDRQNLVRRALSRLSLRQLEAALAKLADIDKIAKGMMPMSLTHSNAWLEISRLCYGLARVGKRRE